VVTVAAFDDVVSADVISDRLADNEMSYLIINALSVIFSDVIDSADFVSSELIKL
jgi:hypothetical protein